jgi:hypothetical protein
MRQQKREHDRGGETALSKARLQKLADVGFEWNTRRSLQFWHSMADTQFAESWEVKFNELLDFKKKNGNCLVPKVFPQNPVSLRGLCSFFPFISFVLAYNSL